MNPGSLLSPAVTSKGSELEYVISSPSGDIHCPMFGSFEPEIHCRDATWPKLSAMMSVLFVSGVEPSEPIE